MANKKDADVAVEMLHAKLAAAGVRMLNVAATREGLVARLAAGADSTKLPTTCGGHKVRVAD